MKDQEFFEWLKKSFEENTASSRLSNCERIEKYEGNLDDHYKNDRGKNLIVRLTYTTNDHEHGRPAGHRIPIKGNIYNGTQTLKQAAKLYFEFVSGNALHRTHQERRPRQHNQNRQTTERKNSWPVWDIPSDAELIESIRLIAKYAKFLSPQIVARLVDDNEKHRNEWSEKLREKKIEPIIYLWEKSPCAFPGVRRYSGSQEVAAYRGHTTVEDIIRTGAVRLDDNDFPKHIWAFVFTGKQFQKRGPSLFNLAHLADHKGGSSRIEDEFTIVPDIEKHPAFGLYTSPANTCYIPQVLIRPTDFSPVIRRLLISRAFELYRDVCNLLPPWLAEKRAINELFSLNDFEWAQPVGDLTSLESFFNYRSMIIAAYMRESVSGEVLPHQPVD